MYANIVVYINKIVTAYVNIVATNAKIGVNIRIIVNANKSTHNIKKIYINK